ncbi:MAG: glycosyltransferase family 2 protein [Eubacteriales bacterium]|nr:glycosyltransferase family 2 protein [Eubacteriales bacterium]
MRMISVIVPCFNEREVLPAMYAELERVRKEDFCGVAEFEYIFVDDGSSDGTVGFIKELRRSDKRVRFISFSRNFGKEAAISAGLQAAKGDLVTLMDADLQDPPSLLKPMYDAIVNEGYEQVATRRVTRKGEPPLRSFCARMFYKLINSASDFEMTDGARDYRLMTRKVVDAILSLPEKSRYSKGIFSFVGFRTKWIPYENVERAAGKTKWSFRKLFRYATDGLISFSDLFLKFSRSLCALFFIFFFALAISSVILKNSALAVLGVGFLVGGTVLVSQIVNGKYLEQTFREVKQRPLYIISETERDGEKE